MIFNNILLGTVRDLQLVYKKIKTIALGYGTFTKRRVLIFTEVFPSEFQK